MQNTILADAPEQLLIKRLLDPHNSSGSIKIFSKGEYLIKKARLNNHYILLIGAVRVFHVTEFEEQTIRFGYEGSIITSLSSFITGKPSEFYIEALRKTTVKIIPKQQLFEIVNESPET